MLGENWLEESQNKVRTNEKEEVAKSANAPLFRVRSGIREMLAAGLVEEQQGKYSLTELGLQKIEA